MGIQVAMMTGDHERTAQAIAAEVGIDRVFSEVLPQDKANYVSKLQEEGYIVAMVEMVSMMPQLLHKHKLVSQSVPEQT